MAITTCTTCTDPIVTAIADYRAGMEAFGTLPEMTKEDEARAAAATYEPPTEVLENWNRPAETRAGAIAALELVRDGLDHYVDASIAVPLIAAVLGFLRSNAAAEDITEAEIAAIEFEPWVHVTDEWTPPTDEEWANLANPHLVTIRMAWMALYKTKPELVELVDGLHKEGILEPLMDSLNETSKWFEGLCMIAKSALGRMCSAGLSKTGGAA